MLHALLPLLFAVAPARADYLYGSIFSGTTCGPPASLFYNFVEYNGCFAAGDGTYYYNLACINSTAANLNMYNTIGCTGVNISHPMNLPAGCQPYGGAGSQATWSCMNGPWAGAGSAITASVFGPPNTCPPQNDPQIIQVIPRGVCLVPPSEGTQYGVMYQCSATNLTVTSFPTADCSGPSIPPMPLGKIGCELNSSPSEDSGPTVIACGGQAPAEAGASEQQEGIKGAQGAGVLLGAADALAAHRKVMSSAVAEALQRAQKGGADSM